MGTFLYKMSRLDVCTLPVLLAFAAIGCQPTGNAGDTESEVARPAKIITVGLGDGETRAYPGRVQASQRVPLSFRVGGPVVELLVSKGQRVHQGTVLARIDSRDYEVQVKNLEAQLSAANAQHGQAGAEYQRVRALFEHDNASKADFDRGRSALEVTKAQAEAVEQALNAARLALADTELEAPYPGIVADRLVDAYERVDPGQAVLLFQDLAGLEVRIDVPEREVALITGLQTTPLSVSFNALPGVKVAATIKEFGTETDPLTQTFPVTLTVEPVNGHVPLPGMTATVQWTGAVPRGETHTVVVPLEAVLTDEHGATFVWQVDPQSMRIHRLQVTIGTLSNAGLEVLSGLAPGDRILAAGVHFVGEGQLVREMAS